jgi:hypothetical protein
MSGQRGFTAIWRKVRVYVSVAIFFAAVLAIGRAPTA